MIGKSRSKGKSFRRLGSQISEEKTKGEVKSGRTAILDGTWGHPVVAGSVNILVFSRSGLGKLIDDRRRIREGQNTHRTRCIASQANKTKPWSFCERG